MSCPAVITFLAANRDVPYKCELASGHTGVHSSHAGELLFIPPSSTLHLPCDSVVTLKGRTWACPLQSKHHGPHGDVPRQCPWVLENRCAGTIFGRLN